jgi:hypothetical protein
MANCAGKKAQTARDESHSKIETEALRQAEKTKSHPPQDTHPSTKKFTQNRADISDWAQKSMKWTKRVSPI